MNPINNLTDLTVTEFCKVTASEAPTPGGGSISALSGAMAASLAEMVANLSLPKDGPPSPEFLAIKEKANSLQSRLLILVEKDAASFDSVMAAFKLPKATEEEKLQRKKKIQEALKLASKVPLEVALVSTEIFELIPRLLEGNQNAITDAMIAAMNARNAVLGALLNARINLGSIKDDAYVKAALRNIEESEKMARESEEALLAIGYKKLSKE